MLARLPRLLCWLMLGVSYTGLAAVLLAGLEPMFDLIAPLFWHLAGLGLTAIIGLLIQKRVVMVLICGLGVTILAHAVPAYMPDRLRLSVAPEAMAGDWSGSELKVLALTVDPTETTSSHLNSLLETAQADLILLSGPAAAIDTAGSRLRASYPHVVTCTERVSCSLLLLSRLPIAASSAVEQTPDQPAMIWAELARGTAAAGVTVVAARLTPPARDWAQHQRQSEHLIAALATIPGPILASVDFGTTAHTRSFRDLTDRAGLAAAPHILPTWPAWPIALPQFGLAHILVRGDLAIDGVGVGPYAGSAHLPVWSRIVLPGDKGQRLVPAVRRE